MYEANLQEIQRYLTRTHGLPLTTEDLDGVARVYKTFYWYGPAMTYNASTQLTTTPGMGRGTTYRDLMVQGGPSGQGLSYLGSEERFLFLKDLERRNLVVPVVGNFSGPKALRAIGSYLKARDATVTAFYLSNVESYLQRDGTWPAFCANVAAMPLDEGSVFIRPNGLGRLGNVQVIRFVAIDGGNRPVVITGQPPAPAATGPMASAAVGLVPMLEEVKRCAAPRN